MDLTTRYLGLQLRNPVVASAGPLQQNVDGVRALADSGVGAVVMYSLFEEQLRHEAARDLMLEELHAESFAESLSYFPTPPSGDSGISARYLDLLERAVAAVDVPVIASLNGSSVGSWVEFARQMQEAGAAGIELNIYLVPGDVTTDGREVEERHVEILQKVKAATSIPVAVKLSPYLSSIGQLALRLDEAGADGLVLFNRFLQPEVDVENVTTVSGVYLSHREEGRLPRTWIAALRGRVSASLAGTSGVESWEDVARYLLAGADVAMTTSALLRHGPAHAATLIDGVQEWLGRKGFDSLDAARGMLAVPADADATAYERAGYVSALEKAKNVYGNLVGPPGASSFPVASGAPVTVPEPADRVS
ncbi:dihydroorotate dehydrogenase-like protein [Piscicoccus intestinalis]|uniref:dihydroorotate dehydrogenase-like protein n=1 Tax=Piscicoccus intestinalis TaxID=746033 RepID=UPI000A85798D|nr:dihydroorotate dehydrogenase-like protein [Piscicoccus intestinalis]